MARKSQLYDRERFIITHAEKFLKRKDDVLPEEIFFEYENLLIHYKNLLDEIHLMTRVNDKMHNKLHVAHDALKEKQTELERAHEIIAETNTELEENNSTLEQMVFERTQDLNQAYNDLLASNKELDLFVYRASHDIRGPLASLLGLTYLARLEVEDELAKDFFERIERIVRKMDNILSHLQNINRMKNMELKEEKVYPSQLVSEILQHFEDNDIFKGLKITIHLPKVEIKTDILCFKKLIINVLEHMAESLLDSSELKVKGEVQAKNLRICATWKGIVVPKEVQNKVFELFYRIDNHEDLTGLKLYCAKQITEKLKGQITLLESTEKQTIIEVKLPVLFS